ncbi:MAG: hypothetical protein ACJ77Z_13260 [Thermoleophilaceae bacterium]
MTGPVDALPPDAPATVEDVRATRRWTWVAFAWALAASAIAVIALITANDNDTGNQPAQTTPDLSGQVRQFESQTNDRLDQFSRRLNDRAAQSDVQKLDKRLSTVEDDASKSQQAETSQSDAVKQLQADVKDLQQRVDKLEQQGGPGNNAP